MLQAILAGNSWYQGGGGEVFSKFFEWRDYVNFNAIWKSERGEELSDPGRTLFLSTRCKCLTLPSTEQCACKIHTQQVMYLDALRDVPVLGRGACDCRWRSSVDGDKEWKRLWTHLGTFSEALTCAKVDLRGGDFHDEHGFMGRKPDCSSFDCTECGFGRHGGIPTCKVLETSDQRVVWKRYEDVWKLGKKFPNQQVEKEGKLRYFWAEFKMHSKLYMAHHAIAKCQTNCHGLCLDTFKDGDVVIEADFIEKYTHIPKVEGTCPRYAQTTFMVAIVHFSPQVWEGGGRVHLTET